MKNKKSDANSSESVWTDVSMSESFEEKKVELINPATFIVNNCTTNSDMSKLKVDFDPNSIIFLHEDSKLYLITATIDFEMLNMNADLLGNHEL